MQRWLPLLLLALAGCVEAPTSPQKRAPSPTSGARRERLAALRALEQQTRASYRPTEARPWLDVSGADPYRLVAAGSGYLGALRGSRALVRLDRELHEVSRLELTEPPTALCAAEDGSAWLASRYGRTLVHVSPELRVQSTRELGVAGVADVACGERGLVYVLPADGSPLLTLDSRAERRAGPPALPGGLRLARRGRYLLESSLFERTVRVWELSARAEPLREAGRIVHDGTLWAFDAVEQGGALLVAVAGVEDKPLVRVHGEFENIDSFVWLYRVEHGAARQVASLNVSEHGVVVPKAIHVGVEGEHVTLTALASGSGRWLRAELSEPPVISTSPAPPGVADAVFGADGTVTYASPLIDAWVRLDRWGTSVVRVDSERLPELAVRLGEALFFTELMAPENSSEGSHSRFTCETCHFEGGVDGRRHYTGRGSVSVVTKPLFGLANNRPHFSRALDPNLASVSHNEFRVAGAGSGTDPWFSLEATRFPWVRELGLDRARVEPLELRDALTRFLYAFSHPPNPLTAGRARFTPLEAEGASAFAARCESCHAARLVSDDARSAQPFAAWEPLVFSASAPLVWARGDYEKTGVLPYVHERGTRIPSLRRLALKPRYFTNGSARTLEEVVARFRAPLHDAAGESAASPELPPETRRALVAFLKLL